MSRKDEIAGQLSQKASLLATWRGLTEHPGWKLFQKALEEQRMGRLLILSEPSSGFGTILAAEFMKGEANAFNTAKEFPNIQVEMLQVEVKSLQTAVELEEHNETEKSRTADVSSGRVDNERDWFGGAELERFRK